jgi:NitT/TauT family transport system substrate-binding protein
MWPMKSCRLDRHTLLDARGAVVAIACAVAVFLLGIRSAEAETLRIGAQKTGTFAWELGVIKARGLDKAARLDLQIVDLATTEAGKIALAGGSVDIILSDWLWVARERGLGRKLTFAPYSSTLGAVMAKRDGPIRTIADLKGRTLGVAGGPLDKSWLMLQVFAARSGFDVGREAHVVFGAPPLLAQKTAEGELDATLQFWNFCIDLEQHGFRRVVEMADVEKGLGAAGSVAMVGYVFDEDFAARNAAALTKFFEITRQAKVALASDDSLWPDIMTRIGQKDPEAAALYKKRYAEGAPRPTALEEADAKILFRALAQAGDAESVGAKTELDPGTFYKFKGGS